MSLTGELKNQILTIKFSRPEAGNSFGILEAKALNQLISANKKSARAVLFFSSHPRFFCAGGDLKAHQKMKAKKEGVAQASEIRKALNALAKWPIPKAAFVNGDCFGGGLELLSCFDFRVAAPHVMFGFWQRRIALTFGWGGFERWSARISADVIKNLGFSARVFGSNEALRVGVVQQIGDLENAHRWLGQVLRWSDDSAVTLSEINTKNEAQRFEKMWWSPDHQKIIKKFR
jgi:enoyl-CoA hydratase/carnithine racemase